MKKHCSPHLYSQSLALLTDLYQLTMSYGFWKMGLHTKEAVFHLFFRRNPFKGGFTIAAGLESVINFLDHLHFDESDLAYLATIAGNDNQPLFSADFLAFLGSLKFTCDLDAVPEGTVVFPFEPMLRIQGPLIQCQLLESVLLNLVNFPSLIATKAARVCLAAKGESVLEFGLRRAQGIDGAITASRAAYIGGCHATSNVLAGKLFDIPVRGTHSHSWVMAFDEEIEAFQSYAKAMPSNCIFLVDTYDTIEGVKKAIEVGKWLRSQGRKLIGIRLDSGDLADLSIRSRALLDAAGFNDTFIFASNELDETIISELKRQGSLITMWGVGTSMVTGKDQPALDGVYKLSALRNPGEPWHYKLKLSEQATKVSNPGILQVRRFKSGSENVADVIYDVDLKLSESSTMVDPIDPVKQKVLKSGLQSHDLLVPIFREGKRVYTLPTLSEIRSNTQRELSQFPVGIKRFLNPHQYVVGMEKSLYEMKVELINRVRKISPASIAIPSE